MEAFSSICKLRMYQAVAIINPLNMVLFSDAVLIYLPSITLS
jgi:hypothetical protein